MPTIKTIKEGQTVELPKRPGGAEFIEDKELAASPEIKRQVETITSDKTELSAVTAAAVPVIAPARELPPLARKIEAVLEEGLVDIYRELTPPQQAQFRQRGEATVQKIYNLINQVKVRAREVLLLIRDWLKTVPGINKFFIEQTAKIKADKIMKLRQPKS